MTKKAVLVEFSVVTRVVVDVPEGKEVNDNEMFETIGSTALKQVRDNFKDDNYYPYMDNIVVIKEDTEVPYDSQDEKKKI